MLAIRRMGFIFTLLVIGILLGTLGIKTALIIISLPFLLWYMVWDEKSYDSSKIEAEREYEAYQNYIHYQEEQHYTYHQH